MPFMTWSLQPPVYPVYTNKRKHAEEDTDSSEMADILPNKRHCQQDGVDSEAMEEESEINHNTCQQNFNQQETYLTVPSHEKHGCLKDVVGRSELTCQQSLNGSIQMNSQPQNMVMDLCDEIYSNAVLENEECLGAMDNDCVPNNQQYRTEQKSQPDCNDCVGESPSNTSRVRCYCKPTWENFMDLRPYVSDYY